jgi:farnesyl-diphosphate farnesyltransferase
MDPQAADLLTQLLREVSRSFYLTVRALPSRARSQIGLAYLLARASDTLADTEILPPESRLRALSDFSDRVAGRRAAKLEFPEFVANQANPSEAALLRRAEEAIALLGSFDTEDQGLIREVIAVIIGGQELDLRRFSGIKDGIAALETDAELDDYTYRVAGVVGEFWTKICRRHLFPRAPLDVSGLVEKGIRFGKGLQLVNILRDAPKDLRLGRCYFPLDLLRLAGLAPRDLLEPNSYPRFKPVYEPLLDRADGYLRDAWAYTNALPRGQIRVRLACAWPVLIGRDTVRALRAGNVLDPSRRIKVPRRRIYAIMARSILAYPWSGMWTRQFEG